MLKIYGKLSFLKKIDFLTMVFSFLLALGCSLFGVHNGIPPIWMSQNLIQRLTFLIGFSENPSTLFHSAEHPKLQSPPESGRTSL